MRIIGSRKGQSNAPFGDPEMKTLRYPLTKAVPAKLQLDGWWLDSETRPFPKQITAVKVPQKETQA